MCEHPLNSTVLEKGIPIAKFYFIFIYIIIYINISITFDFRTIVFGTVTLQHCNTFVCHSAELHVY